VLDCVLQRSASTFSEMFGSLLVRVLEVCGRRAAGE
jgi:hypothetical protein